VDNVQTGHETIDGALQIRNYVIAALQSADMELKKWAYNHPDRNHHQISLTVAF